MVTLVASNLGGESVAGPELLTTLPVKASIEGEAASSITTTSVSLNAKINPNGADTTYQIQYGTTTSYGKTTAPAKAGAGRTPISVSQAITGLSPETTSTYHWRILATNAAGTTTSTDQTFVDDTTGPGLPDGRQYELVTPPQKNGALIGTAFGGGSAWAPRIAENGQDMIAPSIQCFAGAQSCTGVREREGGAYEFARTSQGWTTNPLAPPSTKFDESTLWAADADQHTTLFSAPSPPEEQDDFYSRDGQESSVDIGPLGEGREGTGGGSTFRKLGLILATGDFSRVLYEGAKLWGFAGQERSVYEYTGSARRPLLVGVTGGFESDELISTCTTGLQGARATELYGSLSNSGRTAYFTAVKCLAGGVGSNAGKPVPANELYARVDGEVSQGPESAHTVLISAPTAGVCENLDCKENTSSEERARNSFFAGASNDGSRVFFTSTQQFTDNANEGAGSAGQDCHEATAGGCNLYESVCAEPCGSPGEEPAAKERELVAVSEAEGAKNASGGPRVQGVMALSADGSHVYFVARGVLTKKPNDQGQTATDGADNLYVYERDTTHPQGNLAFVTTLPAVDETPIGPFGAEVVEWNMGIQLANVTPDGRFWCF